MAKVSEEKCSECGRGRCSNGTCAILLKQGLSPISTHDFCHGQHQPDPKPEIPMGVENWEKSDAEVDELVVAYQMRVGQKGHYCFPWLKSRINTLLKTREHEAEIRGGEQVMRAVEDFKIDTAKGFISLPDLRGLIPLESSSIQLNERHLHAMVMVKNDAVAAARSVLDALRNKSKT